MWRLQTSRGAWAIQEVRRDLPPSIERSFDIECEAVARGVPAPEPRPSTDGDVYAHVDGAVVRCHSWVDGHAKTNETVTVDDAAALGRIVAVLHGLRIVVPAMPRALLAVPSAKRTGSNLLSEARTPMRRGLRGSGPTSRRS